MLLLSALISCVYDNARAPVARLAIDSICHRVTFVTRSSDTLVAYALMHTELVGKRVQSSLCLVRGSTACAELSIAPCH
jgi:hypothetical protein